MIEDFQAEYINCECMSAEHTLRFVVLLEDDPKQSTIETQVYLNHYLPWHSRLWLAIKYVFGYKSKYGAWDNCILKRKDVARLRAMLQEFESITAEKNETT